MTTALFLGDSFLDAGAYTPFSTPLCARLGWTPTVVAHAGSGYLIGATKAAQFETGILSLTPDVVFVQGSSNDLPFPALSRTGFSSAAIAAAALALLTRIRAALPSALVYVTSPLCRWVGIDEANYTGYLAAVSAIIPPGVVWIDALTKPWFTGTGYVGHVIGDGNSDVYKQDVYHPSDPAGVNYLAGRLANAIRPPNTGLVSL